MLTDDEISGLLIHLDERYGEDSRLYVQVGAIADELRSLRGEVKHLRLTLASGSTTVVHDGDGNNAEVDRTFAETLEMFAKEGCAGWSEWLEAKAEDIREALGTEGECDAN